jgi:hypothetical protein
MLWAVRRLKRKTYSSRQAGRCLVLTAPWWDRWGKGPHRWSQRLARLNHALGLDPGDEVDRGQPEGGIAPRGAEANGLVAVAGAAEAGIAAPAVGGDGGGLGHVGGEEAQEARGRGVGQHGQPQPAAPRPGRPGRDPPTSVSSASTRAVSGWRPGRTIALRILCSQDQAVW